MNIHNNCGMCLIEIKNLSVKSGNEILLKDINTSFHCGELPALIGKNGAGKTTLLKSILGERTFTGNIIYKKYDNGKEISPIIGYVPQNLIFDKNTPINVTDFMLIGKTKRPLWLGHSKKDRKYCIDRLKKVNCEELAERKLGELSGGELQRILLSKATDPLPDLLILDEPASGMDINGLDMFYKTVCNLRDSYHISILLVSHDLNLIKKYADKTILIDKTILAQGYTNEVFKTQAFKETFGYLKLEE